MRSEWATAGRLRDELTTDGVQVATILENGDSRELTVKSSFVGRSEWFVLTSMAGSVLVACCVRELRPLEHRSASSAPLRSDTLTQ